MSRKGALYTAVQRRAIDQMLRLATSENKKSILLAAQMAEKMTPGHRKREVDWIIDQIKNETPVLQIARHVARDLSPACREKAIENLILNALLQTSSTRQEFTERTGAHAPLVILVSPTMRCNLTCQGCYAAEYSPDAGLTREQLQGIVDQANDIGVFLFTILGGEPFVYPDLLDFCEENSSSYFMVYTNGTLLDDKQIAKLSRIGNVAPMLSIEGDREVTDARRGDGVYDLLMETMDKLRVAGVGFGASSTVTTRNYRFLISEQFIDLLVNKGAIISWNFLYMPLGRDPDLSLMLNPEQRNEFREGVLRIRAHKPLFSLDFWGDAPLVGGCIAAKWYLHINSEGWVEPCIFTHFATNNIKTSTLEEALTSKYFEEIRKRQPFNHNLLMPCMWIDNPEQSREIMAKTGARPTHEGADVMLTELHDHMDRYAAKANEVFTPVWTCMGGDPLTKYTEEKREREKQEVGR
jgi:MoaA/NifB/PqqE/SkfB family radical SAM enzyme